MTHSSVPAGPDRHGWNSLDHYANTHESCLERFVREGFVLNSTLDWQVLQETVLIRGRIECTSGLYLDVRKMLAIDHRHGRKFVRTIDYSYQALLAGDPSRKIFRYDNFHHDPPLPGHLDDHHRHGWEDQPCEWIGYERWPTLSDVLEELRAWNKGIRPRPIED